MHCACTRTYIRTNTYLYLYMNKYIEKINFHFEYVKHLQNINQQLPKTWIKKIYVYTEKNNIVSETHKYSKRKINLQLSPG